MSVLAEADEHLPPINQRRVISGVRPSGRLHIGNYFGAIQEHLVLQDRYVGGLFYFIADLHGLTDHPHNAAELRDSTLAAAMDYLALGLHPERVNFYRQSDVPQISELMWILTCHASVSALLRGHAYREAKETGGSAGAGVLLYPVLMAADVLAMRATDVPVGSDQTQHVELTRDLARRCNKAWGRDVFPIPVARVGRDRPVPGTDGRKMSKAFGNSIPIFAAPSEIASAVNSILTESVPVGEPPSSPGVVMQLMGLVSMPDEMLEMEESFAGGRLSFAAAKAELTRRLIDFFSEARDRRSAWSGRSDEVEELLAEGAVRARMEAAQTLELVRTMSGVAS